VASVCQLTAHTSNTAKYIFQLRKTVEQRFVLILLRHKWKTSVTQYADLSKW